MRLSVLKFDLEFAMNTVTVIFPALSENEPFARNVAAAFCMRFDPTLDELSDVQTAVSEAVTNCIVHAYPAGEVGSAPCAADCRAFLRSSGARGSLAAKSKAPMTDCRLSGGGIPGSFMSEPSA